MISLATGPSRGKTRIAFYFSRNFSRLSTKQKKLVNFNNFFQIYVLFLVDITVLLLWASFAGCRWSPTIQSSFVYLYLHSYLYLNLYLNLYICVVDKTFLVFWRVLPVASWLVTLRSIFFHHRHFHKVSAAHTWRLHLNILSKRWKF